MQNRDVSIGEAAVALGVSHETLRRWDRAGKLATTRDSAGYRRIAATEIERLLARPRGAPSARAGCNRFGGVVRSVERSGVMAVIDVEAGPFRLAAAVPGRVAGELRLAPGVPVTATVNVTAVSIERDG